MNIQLKCPHCHVDIEVEVASRITFSEDREFRKAMTVLRDKERREGYTTPPIKTLSMGRPSPVVQPPTDPDPDRPRS